VAAGVCAAQKGSMNDRGVAMVEKLKSHLVCLHDDKARTLSVLLRNLLRLDSLRELQDEKEPQNSVHQRMEVSVCFANSR